MDMYASAKTQTLTQFKEVYDKRLLNAVPRAGSPVVFRAMANQTPQNRYDIVEFLIDEGAELNGTNAQGETLLHILFSRPRHSMAQTVALTRSLLDAGVDIDQLDSRNRVAISSSAARSSRSAPRSRCWWGRASMTCPSARGR